MRALPGLGRFGLLVLLAAACNSGEPPDADTLSFTRDTISSEAELAQRTRDFSRAVLRASASGWADPEVSALAAFYTEEVVLFPPRGDPIRGREAARLYWKRPAERRILDHVVRPERIEVGGDLIAEHGQFTLTSQVGDAAPTTGTARYVSVWRRGADGEWYKHLDTWW